MAIIILSIFGGIVLTIGLIVLAIYIRYRYHKFKQHQKFILEAEIILSQRGQAMTPHIKQSLKMMLNKSEQNYYTDPSIAKNNTWPKGVDQPSFMR